jgi:D-alanine-D-alanine ligase
VTLGVLFGGPSPEHDISILTGMLVVHELARHHNDVAAIYWTKDGNFVRVDNAVEAEAFVNGVPQGSTALELRLGETRGFVEVAGRFGKDKPLALDAVVMATHGGPGEDGSLQGVLDICEIPYTGPCVAGASLGMDKWAFAAVVASAGLPSLPRILLTSATTSLPFSGPYILKPRFGGSSIGIDVVSDLDTAKARLTTNVHLARGCVLEPYRPDLVDIQVALRSYPEIQLSAIERPIRRSATTEILDYRDKYVGGEGMVSAPREIPAILPGTQAEEIRSYAHRIGDLASVRGVARIDFLVNDHEIYINEINTIPGSLSKHLFVEPPLAFAQLLGDLIREARERPAHRFGTSGADGLVLRSAGAIASKLA